MRVFRRLLLFPRKPWREGRWETLCSTANSQEAVLRRQVAILKEFIDLKEKDIARALVRNLDVLILSDAELRQRLSSFMTLGVSTPNKLDVLKLLNHHHLTILNRFMVMEEYGFLPEKITVNTLIKYLTISKKPVSFLRSRKYLEKDFDVLENLLKYVPLSSHPPLPAPTDDMSLTDIKTKVLEVYLFDELKMDSSAAYRPLSFLARLKHKSLRLLVRNVEVMENDIGISRERLLRNPFLFYTHPDNTVELINKVKDIGGVDIRQVAIAHPRILSYPYENTLKIKQYLKDFGIPDSSVLTCLEIFTYNAESTLLKLKELETDEQFYVFRSHPRVLELVAYQNKLKKRMKLLHEIKLYYASLNTITLEQKAFERFCEVGSDNPKGKDLLYFLSGELKCNRMELKNQLRKNPYWVYVPALRLNQNLKTLRARGFTDEELLRSVNILLYPPESVLNELGSLEAREELECCKMNGFIRRDLLLPLVCYFIEKESNFTGQGVWSKEDLKGRSQHSSTPHNPSPTSDLPLHEEKPL